MKRRPPPVLLLTVPETAQVLRLGDNEVRRLVAEGAIPSLRWRPSSHPLIRITDVEAFIEAHYSTSPVEAKASA